MSESKTEARQENDFDRNHKCWRCKVHCFGIYEQQLKLVGGFNTNLCRDCQNDWDVYIRNHHLFLQLHMIDSKKNMLFAQTVNDGDDRTDLLYRLDLEKIDTNKKLFTIAETWTADVIERPAPPPPLPPTPEELAEMKERRIKRLRSQLAMMEGK